MKLRADRALAFAKVLAYRMHGWATPLLGRFGNFEPDGPLRWLRFLPALPAALQRYAPIPVWPEPDKSTPPELRTVAGIERDPDLEQQAFERRPLRDFVGVHWEAVKWLQHHGWDFIVPTAPRILRGLSAVASASRGRPRAKPVSTDAAEVSKLIERYAVEIGLSAVGFAPYDPKYTFAEFADKGDENVVVCLVEQDWAATQTAPSGRAERAAFRSYAELADRMALLATYIQTLGYRARPQDFAGEGVFIHYGVQAGLGQMGLNGQLLTPAAGSRARLSLILTNAPLAFGEPVDYGINRICDECQACVRRCPVGAIPLKRHEHRGVVKAPIKPERCFPVVAQAHGCAICMKVCPVQRYGLDAVKEHYVEHGEILGKGTDELEGFPWPLDGLHYGPEDKPRVNGAELLNPPGWIFEKKRLMGDGATDVARDD